MRQLLSLLRFDLHRIRNWFRNHLATKIVVILGFVAVLLFMIIIEFFLARTFFMFTASQKEFGKAVAQYSLNSAFLVLFLLGIASSFATSSSSFFKAHHLRLLMSVPISEIKLFVSRLYSSLFNSLFVIIVLLTPILFAFSISFSSQSGFLLRGVASLLMLALSSHALGALFSLLFVYKFGRVSRKTLGLSFIFFFVAAFVLMRFLFPPGFFELYYASDWKSFQSQLGQLPLLSTYLPTNWLVKTITNNWGTSTVIALLSTLATISLTIWAGKKYYLSAWRRAHEGYFLAGSSTPRKKYTSGYPTILQSPSGALLSNEFLSLIRSPSEGGYIAFLSGLTLVILYLIRNIPALKEVKPEFLPAVETLSFVGLSYLFTTLSARIIYPLMAREKRTSWLIFSIPLKREAILTTKLSFAFLLSLPMLVIGFIAGTLAEFSLINSIYYSLLLFVTAVCVSFLQLLLGVISPNFAESDNLEAASTSGSGLAAITFSLLFIAISAVLFYLVLNGIILNTVGILLTVGFALSIIVPLFMLARRNIFAYNL